ncbi:MAG: phage tail sheath family protein [Nitrosomonas sp.]|uniref:phage tail sheath family protein n=1 Tax=Nitrosomonas sp. TaxID=42353 RepID=UPI0032EBC904
MPEYLAPGVYVEETSFRSKSIEGVSTTITGFIGPTCFGPLDIEPDIVTSLVEFERTYGGRNKLSFPNGEIDNFMWHAVRAFFEEGGKRLYISRIYEPEKPDELDGYATEKLPSGSPPLSFHIRSRFPGRAGDARVTFTLKVGQNVLVQEVAGTGSLKRLNSVVDRDVVWIRDVQSPLSPPVGTGGYHLALWDPDQRTWKFAAAGENLSTAKLELQRDLDTTLGHEIRIVTVTVAVEPLAVGFEPFVVADLPLDPNHQRSGSPDSMFAYFAEHPASLARARTTPIVIYGALTNTTGVDVLQDFVNAYPITNQPLDPHDPGLQVNIENPTSNIQKRSIPVQLIGGKDGKRPTSGFYEGKGGSESDSPKTGLKQFEDLEDISIVAAPGSTFGYQSNQQDAQAIIGLIISHAQRMRYRIAVIDSGDNQAISEVRAMRARLDSSYAALYYPWIKIVDPLTQREIHVPPSGFVAGIYARNDVNRAVYKAPANEVVNLAIGFEKFLNKSQQEVLNPEGINCFRFFEGRGMRLWGARTISSDPEWKYVNLRRYFAYLERSIDRGTQWAVFEPNGELLWANIRRTIGDFMLNEWQSGALLGEKPEKAFFVKCDRSTMSQNDIDNGRLVCLIGLAPLRPAEFVIFRIGQWTADRKI